MSSDMPGNQGPLDGRALLRDGLKIRQPERDIVGRRLRAEPDGVANRGSECLRGDRSGQLGMFKGSPEINSRLAHRSRRQTGKTVLCRGWLGWKAYEVHLRVHHIAWESSRGEAIAGRCPSGRSFITAGPLEQQAFGPGSLDASP